MIPRATEMLCRATGGPRACSSTTLTYDNTLSYLSIENQT